MVDTLTPSAPTTSRQRKAQKDAEQARTIYLANLALGHEMTGLELGEACDGLTDSWGRARIREIKASLLPPVPSPAPAEPSEPTEPERNETSETPAPDERTLPPMLTPPTSVEPLPAPVQEPEQTAESPEPERNDACSGVQRRPVTWPVILLMLPATVAIWSGWVGLGSLAGFGPVAPLPGIVDSFVIDSSITLPIGMETYAGYALYVWLSGRARGRALRMARWSAIVALAVGALGQVAYHLLVAAGVGAAPWWITAAVACLPVAVLGMGAALAHMVRAEASEA